MGKSMLSQYPVQQIVDLLQKCTTEQMKTIADWLAGRIAKLETDITEWKLEDVEMTIRTRNVLYKNNIDTVGKMLQLEPILLQDLVLGRAGNTVKEEIRQIIARSKVPDDKTEWKFEDLEMSSRSRNALNRMNIDTIGKLLDLEPVLNNNIGLEMAGTTVKAELRQVIDQLKEKRQKMEEEKKAAR